MTRRTEPEPVASLTWDQVLSWRSTRHHLARRVPRSRLVDLVGEVGGLQAQVASAAELAAWVRVSGLKAGDVRDALWERRALVKTWLMRGTLHLLPAADLPTWIAALRTHTRFRANASLKSVGLSAAELDATVAAIGEALDDEVLTREELGERVGALVGPHVRELMASGWGELLKPAAFAGLLCSGPDRGRNVTFTRPDRWLGGWTDVDADEAFRTIVLRYLAAYGPASHESFARWWGIAAPAMRRRFDAMSDELVRVDVEGYRSWLVPADLAAVRRSKPKGVTRLLPSFDVYVVASHPRQAVIPPERLTEVSRAAGWFSPTVVIDGRVAGVWDQEARKDRIDVTIRPFRKLPAAVKTAIGQEADRLGVFLGSPVSVSYSG